MSDMLNRLTRVLVDAGELATIIDEGEVVDVRHDGALLLKINQATFLLGLAKSIRTTAPKLQEEIATVLFPTEQVIDVLTTGIRQACKDLNIQSILPPTEPTSPAGHVALLHNYVGGVNKCVAEMLDKNKAQRQRAEEAEADAKACRAENDKLRKSYDDLDSEYQGFIREVAQAVADLPHCKLDLDTSPPIPDDVVEALRNASAQIREGFAKLRKDNETLHKRLAGAEAELNVAPMFLQHVYRERLKALEQFSPEHDDAHHADGELGMAAAVLAHPDLQRPALSWAHTLRLRHKRPEQLVIAAGLLWAEYERLERRGETMAPYCVDKTAPSVQVLGTSIPLEDVETLPDEAPADTCDEEAAAHDPRPMKSVEAYLEEQLKAERRRADVAEEERDRLMKAVLSHIESLPFSAVVLADPPDAVDAAVDTLQDLADVVGLDVKSNRQRAEQAQRSADAATKRMHELEREVDRLTGRLKEQEALRALEQRQASTPEPELAREAWQELGRLLDEADGITSPASVPWVVAVRTLVRALVASEIVSPELLAVRP